MIKLAQIKSSFRNGNHPFYCVDYKLKLLIIFEHMVRFVMNTYLIGVQP